MAGLAQMAKGGGAPMQQEPPMPEQDVNMTERGEEEVRPLDEGEELDSDIAYGLLASIILEDDAVQSIKGLTQSQNPIPIIAAMISNSVKELVSGLQDSDMNVSPNVWLADGGAVDRAIDLVSDIAGGLPDEIKNGVFSDVVDQVKLMSQGGGQQGGPEMMGAPQGMGQPPMPQMMGGM